MNDFETYNPAIEDNAGALSSRTYSDIDSSDINFGNDQPVSGGPREQKGKKRAGARKPRKQRSRKAEPGVSLKEVISTFFADGRTRAIIGIAALLFGIYLLLAFISYISVGFHDQSEVQNLATGAASHIRNTAGEGGARLSDILINDSFGLGSGVIILWLVGIALKQFGLLRFKIVNFTIKCLVALITISLIIGLLTIGLDADFLWGGAHGYYVNSQIIHYLGWAGAALLCILLVALFFVLCLYDIYKFFARIAAKRKEEREARKAEAEKRAELERKIADLRALEEEAEIPDQVSAETQDEYLTFTAADSNEDSAASSEDNAVSDNPDVADHTDRNHDTEPDFDSEDDNLPAQTSALQVVEKTYTEENDSAAGNMEIETSTGTMTVTTNEIGKAVDDNSNPNVFDPTAELSHYQFPSYSLLRESRTRISVDQDEQLENQEKIRSTLADFGIGITDIRATVGPTVTLYEIRPDKGVKIAKIRNLGDDIALSLAALGVRIIAPIPGKGTVGIEVANKDPQTVSMRTIITSAKYQECKYELPLAIGSTINNQVYIADLTKMPHLLVAGATGQGKSVGLNSMITSLLYSKHPAELKFVLIDPKMVEFSLYRALERHYLAKLPDEEEPVITVPEKVVATLSSLCVEMGMRYDLLKSAGVRNIKEYNAKFIAKSLNPEKGHRFMPYIVVIVDEFADLIMTVGKEVETPIARLAQKARAVGIHVILATQRPSANVITGVIKANFPARIAFKVASGIDSRTVLDTMGAQQLIGRGDMLISNNSEMERVQCAFIDTPEVTAICEHIKNQVGYASAYLLPEPVNTNGGDTSGGDTGYGDRDPLFEEIARWVVTANTASTSSLQRRYRIGFNRAGSIMDQLEAAGIVSPASGGKPRQVLVDAQTLEAILAGL
ncbi:MAG: DNA translocase FtsK [Muribaculaceae bacterium]|nr:DNA translocase FtsK [Muribaculaceae bacterium]